MCTELWVGPVFPCNITNYSVEKAQYLVKMELIFSKVLYAPSSHHTYACFLDRMQYMHDLIQLIGNVVLGAATATALSGVVCTLHT